MINLTKFLEQHSVKFIDFRFIDLLGKIHSTTYNADRFNDATILDVKNYEENDLMPDMQTIFIDPFCVQSTAVVLCNYGSRSIAKKAYNYMLSTKVADQMQCSFEIEFSIFDQVKFRSNPYDAHISLTPVEEFFYLKKSIKGNYESTSISDPFFDLRSEIVLMMQDSSIRNSLYHKKVSSIQGAVFVGNNDFLNSVDDIQKSKHVIRNVANSYGKTATFMPNPIIQAKSSNLSLYHLLLKNKENLFKDMKKRSYYMGGIMKHIKAINAYTNPTTNSYKKSIELPNSDQISTQCNLSFPDTATNPYLCATAILMAGLDGIHNKVSLVQERVSKSLHESLDALDTDREFLLRDKVFTNKQIDQYIMAKDEESKNIDAAIHPAEFVQYYKV